MPWSTGVEGAAERFVKQQPGDAAAQTRVSFAPWADDTYHGWAPLMETNMQLLKKIVDIFNTGDVSEVDSLFSSDYLDHQRPEGLDIDGPEEFKQIVKGVREALSNLKVTIVDTVSEGNKLAARLHWQGTISTGQTIERETIDILLVQNGKVSEHWGAEAWVKH